MPKFCDILKDIPQSIANSTGAFLGAFSLQSKAERNVNDPRDSTKAQAVRATETNPDQLMKLLKLSRGVIRRLPAV